MKPSSEAIRKWVSLGGSLAVVSAAASVEPMANPSTSATIEESNAKPIDMESKTRTEIPETTTAATIDDRDPHFGEGIRNPNPESESDESFIEPSSHLINVNVNVNVNLDASFSERRPRLSLERCHPDLGVLACTQPGESCVAVVSGDDGARGDGTASANAMRALSSNGDGDGDDDDDGFGWYCLPHHHGEDTDAEDVSSADHYHRALQTPAATVLTPSSFLLVPAPGGANEVYDFCKQAFTYDSTSDPRNNNPSSYDVCICQGYDNNLPDPKYANYCDRDVMIGYCSKYHPKEDPSNNKLPYDSCICTLLTDDHPTEDDPTFCSTFPTLYCGYKDATAIQSCTCELFLEGCGTTLPTSSSSSASSPFESFVEPSAMPSEAPALPTDAPTTTAPVPVPAPTDAPTNEPVPVPVPTEPVDGDADGDGDAAEPTGETPGDDAPPTDGDGDAAPTEAPVPLGGFQATNIRQPTMGAPSPLLPSSGKKHHSSSASVSVSASVSLAVTTAVAACAVGNALGAFVA
mmetsp:Transcript_17765/g.49208  ORF Transcript_17765/g.49208 Transcript_17765/m.49208 type:complete len:520 (+) Transcript_17765:395-1954(+)